MYGTLRDRLPGWLKAHLLHFETAINTAVEEFAASLPDRARVLDAGAGEMVHARYFSRQRYCGVDLGIGDAAWNYRELDAVADLISLPFADGVFAAAINIVTLEHVREPARVLCELARVIAPGGQLLLVAPHEWEVHQSPNDYFRYTRHGLAYLLTVAGFTDASIRPVGGYFRLMSRRLLNGLQFFPGLWFLPALLLLAPPALLMPLFDRLDRRRDFTLGYICTARKPLH